MRALSDDGHTLGLYFFDDPLASGIAANFNVYTDHTGDNVTFFGTLYYPTPAAGGGSK